MTEKVLQLRKRNEQYTIYDLWIGDYIMSVTNLNPGQVTIGHEHHWEEVYYIACGFGRIVLGNQSLLITPGQFVKIPRDTFHRVFNDDKNGQLVLVCVFKGNEKGGDVK